MIAYVGTKITGRGTPGISDSFQRDPIQSVIVKVRLPKLSNFWSHLFHPQYHLYNSKRMEILGMLTLNNSLKLFIQNTVSTIIMQTI